MARETDVRKAGYETGWPQNRLNSVVIRIRQCIVREIDVLCGG